ncbi:hypothetical protein EFA46_015895 (plasmid) [Halarchaeum sp. CBA1220]|nr:hypothetical protein [Halarchaeum sp. CBA1220]QLC35740.1 hypothetical protein EFA46_015895 [Halarchaeum sp. CBA1220]
MNSRDPEPSDADWAAANEAKIREFAGHDADYAWVFQRLLENTEDIDA